MSGQQPTPRSVHYSDCLLPSEHTVCRHPKRFRRGSGSSGNLEVVVQERDSRYPISTMAPRRTARGSAVSPSPASPARPQQEISSPDGPVSASPGSARPVPSGPRRVLSPSVQNGNPPLHALAVNPRLPSQGDTMADRQQHWQRTAWQIQRCANQVDRDWPPEEILRAALLHPA